MLERLCNKTEFEVEGWRKILPLMKILDCYLKSDIVSKLKIVMKEERVIQDYQLIVNEQNFKDAWDNRDFDNAFNQGFMAKIKNSWIYNHFKDDATKMNKIVLHVSVPLTIKEIINYENLYALTSVGSHCVVVKGIQKRTSELNSNDNLTADTQNRCEEFLEIENFDGSGNGYISVENPFLEEVQAIVQQIHKDLPGEEKDDERKRRLNLYGSILENKLNGFENHRDHVFILATVPPIPGFELDIAPCFQLKFTFEETAKI